MKRVERLTLLNLTENRSSAVHVTACSLILLNDDARVLLIKNQESGEWTLPLAEVRAGETAVDAAVRGASEELNIKLRGVEPIGLSTANESNTVLTAEYGTLQLSNFIFSSTYWQQNKETESDTDHTMSYFSMADLPTLNAQTTHILQLFKAWLPSRVFQFA